MDKRDLNLKEDTGFGAIRNRSIKHTLLRITDVSIREEYLNSLRKEDERKFNEFMEDYELSKLI